jgi:hypothetical protein
METHSRDQSQINVSEYDDGQQQQDMSGYYDEEGNYWKYENEENDGDEQVEGQEEDDESGHDYNEDGEGQDESHLNNFSEEDFSVKEDGTEKSLTRSEGNVKLIFYFSIKKFEFL